VASGEEGLAKVAGGDLFGIPDCGEVDTGIPAKQKIDVDRYLFELQRLDRCKRVKQGSEATGVH
jgi:hypothetical protein